MGDVIEFKAPAAAAEYASRLASTARQAWELRQALFGLAFELALLKDWKEWNDAQPVGAELRVGPDELLECADENVRTLTRAVCAVEVAHVSLAEAAGIRPYEAGDGDA